MADDNTSVVAWSTIVGSFYIAMGQAIFATNDVIVKLSDLKVAQLVMGRYLIQFLIAVYWWNLHKPKQSHINHWYGDQPYISNIWLRGIFFSFNTICTWYAVKRCPVADVIAIYKQNIILTAIIGRFYYKEKLPKLFPLILITSITGILFITQPSWLSIFIQTNIFHSNQDIEPLHIDGVIAMLIAMICWSLSSVLIRGAQKSHFLQMEMVSSGLTVFITVPLVIFINQYILDSALLGGLRSSDWSFNLYSCLIMILVGFMGFMAVCFTVVGFQKGNATQVTWLESLGVVCAVLYQTYLFNDTLNFYEGIGIGLVLFACCANILEQFYDYKIGKDSEYSQVSVDSTTDTEYEYENEEEDFRAVI